MQRVADLTFAFKPKVLAERRSSLFPAPASLRLESAGHTSCTLLDFWQSIQRDQSVDGSVVLLDFKL